MSSQDSTIADTLAVVVALGRHLKEDNYTHSIKYILRESLKSKNAGFAAQQENADATIPRNQLRYGYEDK